MTTRSISPQHLRSPMLILSTNLKKLSTGANGQKEDTASFFVRAVFSELSWRAQRRQTMMAGAAVRGTDLGPTRQQGGGPSQAPLDPPPWHGFLSLLGALYFGGSAGALIRPRTAPLQTGPSCRVSLQGRRRKKHHVMVCKHPVSSLLLNASDDLPRVSGMYSVQVSLWCRTRSERQAARPSLRRFLLPPARGSGTDTNRVESAAIGHLFCPDTLSSRYSTSQVRRPPSRSAPPLWTGFAAASPSGISRRRRSKDAAPTGNSAPLSG